MKWHKFISDTCIFSVKVITIQGRPGGGGGVVEYQNTRNKPSRIPKKTKTRVCKMPKIKNTTVYFIPKLSSELSKEYVV